MEITARCFEVRRCVDGVALTSALADGPFDLLNALLCRENVSEGWSPRDCQKPVNIVERITVYDSTGAMDFFEPVASGVVLAKLSDEEIDALCGQIWGL